MESDLIPVELLIQFNYKAISVHVVNINTRDKIAEIGVTPAGIEWYVQLYTYFREHQHMLFGRRTIERTLIEIGTVVPEESPQRTIVMRGRNLVTGLPAAVEMSSSTIYGIIEGLLSTLPGSLRNAFHNEINLPTSRSASVDDSPEDILRLHGLSLQHVTLYDGDFPPVKGFDQWLQNLFGVPLQHVQQRVFRTLTTAIWIEPTSD